MTTLLRIGCLATLSVSLIACGIGKSSKDDDSSSSGTAAATTTSTTATTSASPPANIPTVQPAPPPLRGSAAAAPLAVGLPSFAGLVKVAEPAVVTVRAWKLGSNSRGQRLRRAQGVGTGFVYDPKGFLLTNNHVIAKANEISVTFSDDRELEATVVGADEPTDIAVLKVEATGLASLPLGDSEALQVGDWVVAIGNPFGLERTVSAGILSARGRTRDDVIGLNEQGYFNFLQTDASINPGNSGGPLLNLAGQAIGINSAVRANANNIGFAIPMDMVVQLLPRLLSDGGIERSALGVVVVRMTAADAQRLKRAREGAKIAELAPGQAADQAGLRPDDIILEFNGKPVKDTNDLRWLASIAGVDNTVVVKIARGKRVFDTRVKLGKLRTVK